MALHYQLDFFRDSQKTRDQIEIDALHDAVRLQKESNDKVRKALFARNGELVKRIIELENRLQYLENGLCNSRAISV